MSFVNSFNATLLTGISKAIGLLSSAPFVGNSAANLSAKANDLASRYSLAAVNQGGSGAAMSMALFQDIGKKIGNSFDRGKVFNTDSAESRLSALTDSLQLSKNSSNQAARDRSAGRLLDQSAFNAGNLGMGGPVIADSLQRVGGGGGFLNPNGLADVQREHLNETKKSNTLLQQILAKSQMSPVMMAVLGQS